MNAHSIRHAWFPPAIPKRKYELERDGDGGEIDVESEWPSAYRALSAAGGGPGTGTARPAKRLRALEGGLAGLSLKTPTPTPTAPTSTSTPITAPTTATTTTTRVHVEPIKINTSPSLVSSSENQIHDAPLEGEIEPYISSIYEWASPHTSTAPVSGGIGSSVASLPLCGEVSEVNTSDESDSGGRSNERRSRKGRMGEGVFVHAEQGMPGYTVYEPEWGPEKRKREQGDDDTHLPEKKGKRTWYEPEKDRIVILDLDSSEDESVNRSPRRRRSAFSLSSSSSSAPGSPVTRPRSQTEAQPEYVINHTLLAHISPPGTREGGLVSIPREEDPSKAVVLYKPAPWVGSSTEREGNTADESEAAPMEASPLIRDDDAMDIDM